MCEEAWGVAAGCMVVLHLGYQWGILGVEGKWRGEANCIDVDETSGKGIYAYLLEDFSTHLHFADSSPKCSYVD
jgi:hypothetical protein